MFVLTLAAVQLQETKRGRGGARHLQVWPTWVGDEEKNQIIYFISSLQLRTPGCLMTHCDVEPSSRNVAAGEVCGDGGGVEKATCSSSHKESNGKNKTDKVIRAFL